MRVMIDDTRDETNVNTSLDFIARNYWSGLHLLESIPLIETLYLDHDLHSYDEDGREWTGYDIIKWIEEHPERKPEKIICISSNPPGRERIETVIKKLYGELYVSKS